MKDFICSVNQSGKSDKIKNFKSTRKGKNLFETGTTWKKGVKGVYGGKNSRRK